MKLCPFGIEVLKAVESHLAGHIRSRANSPNNYKYFKIEDDFA